MNDKPREKTPKDKRKLGTIVPEPPQKRKEGKKARKSPKKPNESLGFIIQMKRSFWCNSTKHQKIAARQFEPTYMVNRDPRHR